MQIKLNTEKCYLLGLLVGGGIIKSDMLQIIMPYKKWGSLKINPKRGGEIAEDILKRAKPLWKLHYDVDISYRIDGEWKIIFEKITPELKNDLQALSLIGSGDFRENADISVLEKALKNEGMIKAFIAGLVDTVGSLTLTHRRFTEDFQIVSLELKGKNFQLVTSIVNLLSRINCVPDQILWNHPNQHSGHDRYYKSWKKGFKIRVALDDYVLKGSFVFEAKQLSAMQNRNIQRRTVTTEGKILKIEGRTTVHSDEDSAWLPLSLRGLHFIHYMHLAAFLGAHMPNNPFEKESFQYEKFICPFTVLTKGTSVDIKRIIADEEYLRKTKYSFVDSNINYFLQAFDANRSMLMFGKSARDGFPINYILQGIAYVIGASIRDRRIKGKRVLGNYVDLIKENLAHVQQLSIKIGVPNKGTCLLIQNSQFAALIGYFNDDFNKKIMHVRKLAVKINKPAFEDCLNLG